MTLTNPHVMKASQAAGLSPDVWTQVVSVLKSLGGIYAWIGVMLEMLISHSSPPPPVPH